MAAGNPRKRVLRRPVPATTHGYRPGTLELDFGALADAISQVHERFPAQASRAVNVAVTMRNWATGFYIREYEQRGLDRAAYCTRLLHSLSRRLMALGVPGLAARTLRQCRQFYLVYPAIGRTLIANSVGPTSAPIWQTLSAKFTSAASSADSELRTDLESLVVSVSFSHFVELMSVEDPLKRSFYELECVRGNWSVRELQRQVTSLYFERSKLSNSQARLAVSVQGKAEPAVPRLAFRDPYVFEFLGLKSHEVVGESDLEDGLLEKLQSFLIELGHGFCFEARQKRILIGDTYSFVDLVFYHRIVKCHVLIELKVAGFSHEHLGQLNTYVSWYKRNVMTTRDNPPIGMLLCTHKDRALVEYALADLPNRLFVSKYELELPSRKQLRCFLDAQLQAR